MYGANEQGVSSGRLSRSASFLPDGSLGTRPPQHLSVWLLAIVSWFFASVFKQVYVF